MSNPVVVCSCQLPLQFPVDGSNCQFQVPIIIFNATTYCNTSCYNNLRLSRRKTRNRLRMWFRYSSVRKSCDLMKISGKQLSSYFQAKYPGHLLNPSTFQFLLYTGQFQLPFPILNSNYRCHLSIPIAISNYQFQLSFVVVNSNLLFVAFNVDWRL